SSRVSATKSSISAAVELEASPRSSPPWPKTWGPPGRFPRADWVPKTRSSRTAPTRHQSWVGRRALHSNGAFEPTSRTLTTESLAHDRFSPRPRHTHLQSLRDAALHPRSARAGLRGAEGLG